MFFLFKDNNQKEKEQENEEGRPKIIGDATKAAEVRRFRRSWY